MAPPAVSTTALHPVARSRLVTRVRCLAVRERPANQPGAVLGVAGDAPLRPLQAATRTGLLPLLRSATSVLLMTSPREAALLEEQSRLARLPATSAYAQHRRAVVARALCLLAPRTMAEADELDSLLALLSLR